MAQRFLTPEVYLESQAGWDDGLVVRNREGEEAAAALGRGGGPPQAVWIGVSSREDTGQFGAERSAPMIWAKTKLAFLTPSSRNPPVDLEIFPGKNRHP